MRFLMLILWIMNKYVNEIFNVNFMDYEYIC